MIITIFLSLMCSCISQKIDISDIILPGNDSMYINNAQYNLTDDYVEDAITEMVETTEAQTIIIPTTTKITPEIEKTTILYSNFYTIPPDVQIEEYEYDMNRFEEHPCRRNCSDTFTMTCKYHFVVEKYYTMSKACHDCPYNKSHCYKKDCIPTNGISRPIITVNRQIPGPLIEVCEGDEIIVDVENHLPESTTSIHWHGMHQKYTPYMDGVPFVTQCPIVPMTTFRYQLKNLNPGTHFWHSHIGNQRGDGVYGPMIVKKKSEVYSSLYDIDMSEHIIIVHDWTHKTNDHSFISHYHSNGHNKADTILINGRGQYQEFTANGKVEKTPFSSFTVQKGLKYRFRLINAGVLNCPIEISFDNHTILTIASDGQDIQPVQVDSLISYAGERWDFVLEANKPVDNYWIRFRGLLDCDERYKSAYSAGILHYQNSTNEKPKGTVTYKNAIGHGKVLNPMNQNCTDRLCMNNIFSSKFSDRKDINREPDRRFIFAYDFYPLNNPKYHKSPEYAFANVNKKYSVYTPQINHISLKLPPFPLLSQYDDIQPDILCENQLTYNCDSEYCECTNILNVNWGDLIEITLIDLGFTYDANHPFHLHGHYFNVVAVGKVGNNTTIDEINEMDKDGLIKRNLINPVIKDTVNVPDGGYTIVRFYADNPGYWLFHCHLDWHSEHGMGLVFKVGEHNEFPPVPIGFPKCGNYLPSTELSNTIDIIHEDVIYQVYPNDIPRFPRNTTEHETIQKPNFFSKLWSYNNSNVHKYSINLLLLSVLFLFL